MNGGPGRIAKHGQGRSLAARVEKADGAPCRTQIFSLRCAHPAYARRVLRPVEAPPLPRVRSLYYFLPVIEELVQTPLPKLYVDYLRGKLTRAGFNPGLCSKNRVSS